MKGFHTLEAIDVWDFGISEVIESTLNIFRKLT